MEWVNSYGGVGGIVDGDWLSFVLILISLYSFEVQPYKYVKVWILWVMGLESGIHQNGCCLFG